MSAAFIVISSPVFLLRIVTVPSSSSLETTSRSGLAATASLAANTAGFFLADSAYPLNLCTTQYATTANAIAARTRTPPHPPRIQTSGLMPFFCGAGAAG